MTSQTATIQLLKHHTATTVVAANYPCLVRTCRSCDDPGVQGAAFPVTASIDTTALEPGIYEVRLPSNLLQPQNRTNELNFFTSTNWLARFVITSAVPGSLSRILWLHDPLTGTCYGSFGTRSIYGPDAVRCNTVSYARPGLDRATMWWTPLRYFRSRGFQFEFLDLEALAQAPAGTLAPYDLVVLVGQFEYVPHEVLVHLRDHVDAGRNLFAATWEFGSFCVRLDPVSRQLTTYKWNANTLDPLAGTGTPTLAGVRMNNPSAIWETELLGHTVWAARNVGNGAGVDLTIHHADRVQPFLQGTGLHAGSVLPAAFTQWALGNRLQIGGDGEPVLVDAATTRTPADTVVWASTPSSQGRAWWQAQEDEDLLWPFLTDGFAVATYQERANGARIVSLPTSEIATSHITDPLYQKLLLNILTELS